MVLLPQTLTAITDSKNALQRLSEVFGVEPILDEFVKVDDSQQYTLSSGKKCNQKNHFELTTLPCKSSKGP